MRAGIKSSLLRVVPLFFLVFALRLGGVSANVGQAQNPEYQRAKVLALVLRQDLSNLHFSHKKIDDNLSKEAFSQYLKNLDSQKLLLLKEDVKKLSVYADKIDDEINNGTFELPLLTADILARRAADAELMVADILAKDFDFSIDEYYETDPEKIDYSETVQDLRERWRRYLKLQVLQHCLTLQENSSSDKNVKAGPQLEALQQTARERVQHNMRTFFSRIRERKERENYERFFNAIAKTFDPHTEYMPPANKEDFDIDMRGTLEGIGASLKEEDGYIKVMSLIPGGPAARDGNINAEDIILKAGEKDKELVDITYMSVRDAVKLIRGKKGTEARLLIKKPDGSQVQVSIMRDVIKLEESSVKGASLKDEKNGRNFGYIKIPSFYRDFESTKNTGGGRNSTDDLRRELKKIETARISGLIIDLRNNGGGALTDAIKTAGLFIKTGPVVQVKASDGKISVLSDDDPSVSYAGPVVILVNKFSASASEILAGALQDYGRAIVLGGEHTHGKGTVQAIIDLNNFSYHGRDTDAEIKKDESLGALRLTTQKFYRITGESTQYRGIAPDIILPDQFQGLKSGEQYLDFALPWDIIKPVPFKKWTSYRMDFPELGAKSRKRVGAKHEFTEIAERSREMNERQKKTLRPLNMEEAAKERKALEAKKVGHETKKSAGGKNTEKDLESANLSAEERRKLWVKETAEDPYVQEAIAVLNDVIIENAVPASQPVSATGLALTPAN